MQIINVNVQKENDKHYPIYIGHNLLDVIPDAFKSLMGKKVLVVTNETIFELYEDFLPKMFEQIKCNIEYCIIQDGEKYKNKTSLEKILTCAFEAKFERDDVFVAFGGGVIGDITGFAASIYLRGVNFIQIPTTILAQVDSSVGGKVAIDTPYGKNLLGAFYQPQAVISDLNFLKTLPKREILSGLSEVVKYSFIEKTCGGCFTDFSKFLNDNCKSILSLEQNSMESLVKTCCDLKAAVVNQDEKEKGLRAILNFGHTIGHSIEKVTNYSVYTHGEAIAIGMKGIFLIARRMNKIDDTYLNFALNLLASFGLSFKINSDINSDDIFKSLYYDKKVKNGKLRFVVPTAYASVEVLDNVDDDIIADTIKELY